MLQKRCELHFGHCQITFSTTTIFWMQTSFCQGIFFSLNVFDHYQKLLLFKWSQKQFTTIVVYKKLIFSNRPKYMVLMVFKSRYFRRNFYEIIYFMLYTHNTFQIRICSRVLTCEM